MPISALTLAVVGADYPNKRGPTRRFAIGLCRPGDPVLLVPEPKNPADPRAVQVQSAEGVVMGYVSAERCGWIGGMIAEGRDLQAIFQEPTAYGALIRVSLDLNQPDLPPARDPANQDAEWWPDEIPPDD
jgi:hypothetical protein